MNSSELVDIIQHTSKNKNNENSNYKVYVALDAQLIQWDSYLNTQSYLNRVSDKKKHLFQSLVKRNDSKPSRFVNSVKIDLTQSDVVTIDYFEYTVERDDEKIILTPTDARRYKHLKNVNESKHFHVVNQKPNNYDSGYIHKESVLASSYERKFDTTTDNKEDRIQRENFQYEYPVTVESSSDRRQARRKNDANKDSTGKMRIVYEEIPITIRLDNLVKPEQNQKSYEIDLTSLGKHQRSRDDENPVDKQINEKSGVFGSSHHRANQNEIETQFEIKYRTEVVSQINEPSGLVNELGNPLGFIKNQIAEAPVKDEVSSQNTSDARDECDATLDRKEIISSVLIESPSHAENDMPEQELEANETKSIEEDTKREDFSKDIASTVVYTASEVHREKNVSLEKVQDLAENNLDSKQEVFEKNDSPGQEAKQEVAMDENVSTGHVENEKESEPNEVALEQIVSVEVFNKKEEAKKDDAIREIVSVSSVEEKTKIEQDEVQLEPDMSHDEPHSKQELTEVLVSLIGEVVAKEHASLDNEKHFEQNEIQSRKLSDVSEPEPEAKQVLEENEICLRSDEINRGNTVEQLDVETHVENEKDLKVDVVHLKQEILGTELEPKQESTEESISSNDDGVKHSHEVQLKRLADLKEIDFNIDAKQDDLEENQLITTQNLIEVPVSLVQVKNEKDSEQYEVQLEDFKAKQLEPETKEKRLNDAEQGEIVVESEIHSRDENPRVSEQQAHLEKETLTHEEFQKNDTIDDSASSIEIDNDEIQMKIVEDLKEQQIEEVENTILPIDEAKQNNIEETVILAGVKYEKELEQDEIALKRLADLKEIGSEMEPKPDDLIDNVLLKEEIEQVEKTDISVAVLNAGVHLVEASDLKEDFQVQESKQDENIQEPVFDTPELLADLVSSDKSQQVHNSEAEWNGEEEEHEESRQDKTNQSDFVEDSLNLNKPESQAKKGNQDEIEHVPGSSRESETEKKLEKFENESGQEIILKDVEHDQNHDPHATREIESKLIENPDNATSESMSKSSEVELERDEPEKTQEAIKDENKIDGQNEVQQDFIKHVNNFIGQFFHGKDDLNQNELEEILVDSDVKAKAEKEADLQAAQSENSNGECIEIDTSEPLAALELEKLTSEDKHKVVDSQKIFESSDSHFQSEPEEIENKHDCIVPEAIDDKQTCDVSEENKQEPYYTGNNDLPVLFDENELKQDEVELEPDMSHDEPHSKQELTEVLVSLIGEVVAKEHASLDNEKHFEQNEIQSRKLSDVSEPEPEAKQVLEENEICLRSDEINRGNTVEQPDLETHVENEKDLKVDVVHLKQEILGTELEPKQESTEESISKFSQTHEIKHEDTLEKPNVVCVEHEKASEQDLIHESSSDVKDNQEQHGIVVSKEIVSEVEPKPGMMKESFLIKGEEEIKPDYDQKESIVENEENIGSDEMQLAGLKELHLAIENAKQESCIITNEIIASVHAVNEQEHSEIQLEQVAQLNETDLNNEKRCLSMGEEGLAKQSSILVKNEDEVQLKQVSTLKEELSAIESKPEDQEESNQQEEHVVQNIQLIESKPCEADQYPVDEEFQISNRTVLLNKSDKEKVSDLSDVQFQPNTSTESKAVNRPVLPQEKHQTDSKTIESGVDESREDNNDRQPVCGSSSEQIDAEQSQQPADVEQERDEPEKPHEVLRETCEPLVHNEQHTQLIVEQSAHQVESVNIQEVFEQKQILDKDGFKTEASQEKEGVTEETDANGPVRCAVRTEQVFDEVEVEIDQNVCYEDNTHIKPESKQDELGDECLINGDELISESNKQESMDIPLEQTPDYVLPVENFNSKEEMKINETEPVDIELDSNEVQVESVPKIDETSGTLDSQSKSEEHAADTNVQNQVFVLDKQGKLDQDEHQPDQSIRVEQITGLEENQIENSNLNKLFEAVDSISKIVNVSETLLTAGANVANVEHDSPVLDMSKTHSPSHSEISEQSHADESDATEYDSRFKRNTCFSSESLSNLVVDEIGDTNQVVENKQYSTVNNANKSDDAKKTKTSQNKKNKKKVVKLRPLKTTQIKEKPMVLVSEKKPVDSSTLANRAPSANKPPLMVQDKMHVISYSDVVSKSKIPPAKVMITERRQSSSSAKISADSEEISDSGAVIATSTIEDSDFKKVCNEIESLIDASQTDETMGAPMIVSTVQQHMPNIPNETASAIEAIVTTQAESLTPVFQMPNRSASDSFNNSSSVSKSTSPTNRRLLYSEVLASSSKGPSTESLSSNMSSDDNPKSRQRVASHSSQSGNEKKTSSQAGRPMSKQDNRKSRSNKNLPKKH